MRISDDVDKTANQVSFYAGRGLLVESQGPCWFYGSSSEHSVLYQYQIYNATDVRKHLFIVESGDIVLTREIRLDISRPYSIPNAVLPARTRCTGPIHERR